MILPLGPQSAFVMNQGIRRQYRIMIALLCATGDLVLICAGIFGGSALLMQPPWLLVLVVWGDVVFLLRYGFDAFKTAMSSNIELTSAEVLKQGRWKTTVTMLAVTWLNPHVHLDTFVMLGSLGERLDVELKRWFALGIISASLLWFFSLVILTIWLTPHLRTTKSQRVIDLVMGCIMWFTTLQLTRNGIAHAQALFSQALSDGRMKRRH